MHEWPDHGYMMHHLPQREYSLSVDRHLPKLTLDHLEKQLSHISLLKKKANG
jgi:hypothetical protein